MAASSPALSNNSSDTQIPKTTTISTVTATPSSTANASKNLRGLNKPKCIKCGNVARSRCPYQSCKSCCAKAQNPCHIHVLKGSSTFPDKAPSSNSLLFDQHSTEVPASGNSLRVASLRQLSNNFAQFNNLQSPLRSRKPLTRKDAAVINEWRFLKLKEYRNGNIEAENEAFDRYMQNISLLEEVFTGNSTLDGCCEDGSFTGDAKSTSMEDTTQMMIAALKLKLRSNSVRTQNFRKRMRYIVDQGLGKLKKIESNDDGGDQNEADELVKRPKKVKSWRADRAEALNNLIDKLNKARNEEDLNACLEMKSQLLNWHTKTSQLESEDTETCKLQYVKNDTSLKKQSVNYPLKWYSTTGIDQEDLDTIDAHFNSLEEVEDL